MNDDEGWVSAVLNGLGCLGVAILFALVVLVWFGTGGTSVQFR
jgi:hypothetical protein